MDNLTPDARAIVKAINFGWIGRGFMLGLGFWLAGVAIVAGAVTAVLTLGLGGLLLSGSRASTPAAEVSASPASAPLTADPRSWQEQLRAADAAKREADRRLGH